jgi:hypothetical protein
MSRIGQRRWLSIPPVGLVSLLVLCWLISGCAPPGIEEGPVPTPTKTPRTAGSKAASAVTVTLTPLLPTATPLPPTATPAPTTTPTVVSSMAADVNPLTGLKVADPAVLHRQPLMVRIGNDPKVRPQTALSQADIVYEEVMDGYSITRFSAIFLANDPEVIGPVRSARLINLQLAPQYEAALVHAGASNPIRWELAQTTITNLDEYYHQKPYFYDNTKDWRGRLFTSAPELRKYMKNKGMEKTVNLRGFIFSATGTTPVTGTVAISVTIPYPKTTSPVHWKYDAASGRYLRWVQGEPNNDALDGKQLSAANVIIYYAEHQKTDIVEDSNGVTSLRIIVNGEGRAQILRDGLAIEGRWRSDGTHPPEFNDADGRPIPLKPGNSWIEVVPLNYKVEITG